MDKTATVGDRPTACVKTMPNMGEQNKQMLGSRHEKAAGVENWQTF